MSQPLIECQNATKYFDDVTAVDDVNFRLMPGEVLSILGASGCGTPTL
ncbi:MAG: polyamine ABC transporter ATP-binding protein, partial [Chloroflexi bacterium]|nr:polyamine ABC transporter ATP-binding protein [Chloroflexota bacterium]